MDAPQQVLAYAYPVEGTRILIFPDRVAAISPEPRFHTTLAYVLVHEVTHILQGVPRHSREGIMKAQWTPGDYFEMIYHRLGFTEDDLALLYAGLERRRDTSP